MQEEQCVWQKNSITFNNLELPSHLLETEFSLKMQMKVFNITLYSMN